MINISSKQLRQAADLKDKIAALEQELATVLSQYRNGTPSLLKAPKTPKKKGMSAAGRARIAAAQKARWAKVKGVKGKRVAEKVIQAVTATKPALVTKPAKKSRTMSAAQKAKISAAAKKRWAKVKAAGK